MRVDLCRQLSADHDTLVLDPGRDGFLQHRDDACRVTPDVITCEVHVAHFRDTFQIRGHLFERVSLGGFDRQTRAIRAGVVIAQAIFAAGCDDAGIGGARR